MKRSRSIGSLRVFLCHRSWRRVSKENFQWRSRESSRGTKPPRSVERGEPPHFAADLEPTTPCAPPYLNCIVHPARTQNSACSVSPRCTAGSLLFRTGRHSRCPFAHSLSVSLLLLAICAACVPLCLCPTFTVPLCCTSSPPPCHTVDVSCRRVCGAESRGYSARVQCERHKIDSTESL